MYTENGLLVDLGEIREIIERGDVLAAGFRLFPERLLIDTRFDVDDPSGASGLPMVAIVDPVPTMQERFFWLGQHRPSLGVPEQFMFFFWPHSIAYFEESGVWSAVRERVLSSRFAGAADTCDAALRDLAAREREAHAAAVRGDGYQSIWPPR